MNAEVTLSLLQILKTTKTKVGTAVFADSFPFAQSGFSSLALKNAVEGLSAEVNRQTEKIQATFSTEEAFIANFKNSFDAIDKKSQALIRLYKEARGSLRGTSIFAKQEQRWLYIKALEIFLYKYLFWIEDIELNLLGLNKNNHLELDLSLNKSDLLKHLPPNASSLLISFLTGLGLGYLIFQ